MSGMWQVTQRTLWAVVIAGALTLGGCGQDFKSIRVCDESENPCEWDGRCDVALCKNPYPAAPACSTTVTAAGLEWS